MVADIEDYFAEKRGSPELQKYQTSHNRVQGTFLQDFVSVSKLYIFSHTHRRSRCGVVDKPLTL